MASFKLYSSNRCESLLDCLAEVVSEPLSSPLGREVILVQSKGMERWLSMELAHKLGIWMNCRFPFPNTFVWEMFKVVLEDVPDASMFSPQVMTWRIMGLLREHLEEPAFKVLRDYLGERANTLLKRLQVAERIADLFDRYAVYRPDMVLRWEEGVDEHWQAALWRDLATYGEGKHRAAIWNTLMERLRSGKVDPELLPERVSVFGIPALPHYHFEVLRGLATLIDVHFFVMNPTREYWADIVPERRIADASQGDLHFDVGNPLLASMGKLGRDFFAMAMNGEFEEQAVFEDPGEASLLAVIQSDILHLRSRGDVSEKTVVSSDDATLQVHSCHSPMREIEVLYDNLLALFESHPDLTPRDIIVMTPDIETYAPYITAVFGRDQDGKARIPFSIADRRAPSESHTIDVFLKIIGLCKGRFGASDVLDILDSTSVQKQFGLDSRDMDLILEWVRNSGIRWGIDGEHRSRLGLPDFKENSWEAGIERLLLGYALRGNEERLFSDILPYDDMEGNETEVLGRFLEFLDRLFVSVRELESSRTLSEWAEVLKRLKSDFIADEEENRRDLLLLQKEITDLDYQQEVSGFCEPVDLEVIRYYLEKHLRDEELFSGFITGAVTFCEMLPMRSIPFRVVVLIGMNSDAYPREYRPVGFDLMAHDPRPGDRSLRDEDRYLFLEAILSARDYLYVSYVGQSIRDNSEIPPSVLVSELLDYITDGFVVSNGTAMAECLVRRHRLQAFSSAYFSGGKRLFSYSREDCDAARVVSRGRAGATPFIAMPLPQGAGETREVTISALRRFFWNPSRYFLNNRLGIYVDERPIVPTRDESFYKLDKLQEFILMDRLTEKKMAGDDLESLYGLARGEGNLSPGTPGRAVFGEIAEAAGAFAAEVKSHCEVPLLPPVDVDLDVDGFRLTGRLDNIWTSGLVDYRCVDGKRAKDHLPVWINHLILNCVAKPPYPKRSIFVGIGAAWRYNPVNDPEALLRVLLAYFQKGQREPLKFFPESSAAYAKHMKKGATEDDALQAARSEWEGSGFGRSEIDDPYHHLCFGSIDPLDDTFAAIAIDVVGPLVENRGKPNR